MTFKRMNNRPGVVVCPRTTKQYFLNYILCGLCETHCSVVKGISPRTKRSLVQTLLWALDVGVVHLDIVLHLNRLSLPS